VVAATEGGAPSLASSCFATANSMSASASASASASSRAWAVALAPEGAVDGAAVGVSAVATEGVAAGATEKGNLPLATLCAPPCLATANSKGCRLFRTLAKRSPLAFGIKSMLSASRLFSMLDSKESLGSRLFNIGPSKGSGRSRFKNSITS
jgi:hypothetical protein